MKRHWVRQRLKTLIKRTKRDLEEFGDERNSSREAEESKAFIEKELISNDPMTLFYLKRLD